MNILELDSFNLADAAKFHFRLNPKIWGSDEHLLPEVRQNLLEIAEDFREFLGIPELDIKDITISGSNAAYSYTDKSDIDLHLVVDFPANKKESEIWRELFDAKKFQYNELHDFKIGNADVELYVQDADQEHHSQGIYSLLGNKWISVPKRIKAEINHSEVKSKYEDMGHRIERAIASGDEKVQRKMLDRLKELRSAGLAAHGEFGPENLAYKMIRSQGLLQALFDAYHKSKSERLSLEEKAKAEKAKKKFVYGYKEDVSHNENGVSADTCMELNEDDVEEDVSHNENGVSASTCMELNEDSPENVLRQFIDFCVEKLALQNTPNLKLRKDPQWPKTNKTFGKFHPETGVLEVAWGQRHLMDVLRTVAHELTHQKQHERENVPDHAGETGSEWENEANARAGILMRDWGHSHPEMFDMGAEEIDTEILERDKTPASYEYTGDFRTKHPKPARARPVKESASGYIPTKAQAHDPRFEMGLSVDIKPGQIGKEANKLKLKTNKQGKPQIANPNGVFENNKLTTLSGIWAADIRIPTSVKMALVEEYLSNGKMSLLESVSKEVVSFLDNLKQNFSTTPKVGSKYIPTFVIGYNDNLIVHDCLGNTPAKESAQFLTVEDIQGDEIVLSDDNGKQYRYPDMQLKDSACYVLLLNDSENAYNKLRMWIKLKKSIELPKFKEDSLTETLKKQLANFKKNNSLEEEEELDEVNMSPSRLRQFAQSDAAKGMKAGFELELYIPNTEQSSDDDYGDIEPDYDADERIGSIENIGDFFMGGDGGMSRREAEDLRMQVWELYHEALMDRAIQDWNEGDNEEYIRKAHENDFNYSAAMTATLQDLYPELSDEEIDAIEMTAARRPRFTSSKEEKAYTEENPLYSKWLEAATVVDEEIEEEVQKEVEKDTDSKYYDEAWETFIDDFNDNYSQEDFFDDRGWRWMTNVADDLDVPWPYYSYPDSGSNGGDYSVEARAESLENAIGMPVTVSSGYHSARREPDKFIIEPDGSLHDKENEEDAGLEIISPPMDIFTCIEKLQACIDWAQQEKCYTNSSTGLHMGVSLPSQSTKEIDYIKLALFLGDEHVLEDFKRLNNIYTPSATKEIKQAIASKDPAHIKKLLNDMRSGLMKAASEAVKTKNSSRGSINMKDNYIEFRSAGGDTLSRESDEGTAFLENTLLRYVQAMSIAGDANAYRDEYAKKLYKLLDPTKEDSNINLFSKFVAGQIDAATLKSEWAEKTLQKATDTEKGDWEIIDLSTNKPMPGETYRNYTLSAVIAKMKLDWGRNWEEKVEIHKIPQEGEDGDWQVYNIDTGKVYDTKTGPRNEVWDEVNQEYKDHPDISKIGIQRARKATTKATPPKLGRKAELAQRIKQNQKTPQSVIGDEEDEKKTIRHTPALNPAATWPFADANSNDTGSWEFANATNGTVYDTLSNASTSQAESVRRDIARRTGQRVDNITMRRT